jgi:hypothetical protein
MKKFQAYLDNPPPSPFRKGGIIYLFPFLKGGGEGLEETYEV